MSDIDDDFKHESLQDKESIFKYLKAVGEGFKNGRLLLGSRQKNLILEPKGLMKFEVKAKRKGDTIKLALRFDWKDDGPAPAAQGEPLTINTDK
ncbi:MAG: amphi-Trp domain-containing protein [Nitrospinae bacterium]|nr:amphi-Trp domain-containing protein [Nitrospinota bacterium]